MRTNNKKGISLIVLVITIIVMIILAAAIILSISNSGITDKANKAKIDSDISAIKEIMAVYESECAFNDERVTLTGVATRLEENGIKTEKVTSTLPTVKSISLDKTSVEMALNQTVEITVTTEEEESNKEKLYAVISDEYYEIYKNNSGNLEISNEASDLNNQELKIEVEGANYVTTSIDQTTKKITLTSTANAGTDTLAIKCDGKSATCSIRVVAKTLITFTVVCPETLEFYADTNNLTSGTYTAEEGMTWQEFLKSEYNVDNWVQSSSGGFDGPVVLSCSPLGASCCCWLRPVGDTLGVPLSAMIKDTASYEWDTYIEES